MKILITGARGFVGKKLIEYLSGNEEISVVGITRNTGLEGLKHNILPIQADLTYADFTHRLPHDIDTVLYLAQSSEYRNFPGGAADMFAVNVAAVANLLDWSAKNGVKKFILASTGNVYKPKPGLLTESDPVAATSYYSATKLAAENLLFPYQGIFQTIALRIFSVYGHGQQGMMIPTMISKIKSGEIITLAQNKGIMLTPLYVKDAVEMLRRILMTNLSSGVYNFTGNETSSLHDIILQLAKLLNIEPKFKTTDDPPSWLTADGTKLFTFLDFTPKIRMEQGLKLVVAE